MINMEDEMMNDHLDAERFALEFGGISMEYIERPITKRVSHPSTDLCCLLTRHSSYMHLVDGQEARGRHFARYGRNIAPTPLTWTSTRHVSTSSMTNCLLRP
jgi:hypothetical protein